MYLLDNKNNEIALNFDSLILILLCLMGIIIFITANNLFILYLGIELQSLALYILCSLKKYSNKSLEAGFKYYLYGSFSSAILLFAISLIYGLFGSLDLNDIYILINISNFQGNLYIILQIALICLIIGFLFKLAVFPFH
jgi:NADH-quinone oxidoreductase subunit N